MDNTRKKIWVISGEESGDIYGARLINELRAQSPNVEISIMGGKRMIATKAEVMVDATELGVVGILEVLGMIFTFIRIFREMVRRAAREKPDCVVLIDYPGYNLRLAAKLQRLGIPVVWYISPQVWAWKKGRIAKLAAYCRKMLVIFPFEPDVYAGSGLDAEFVGHPLVDVVRERTDPKIKRDDNLMLLLPGSRSNEINRLFVPMLETAMRLKANHPNLRFVVAAPRKTVSDRLTAILEKFKASHPEAEELSVDIECGKTGEFLQKACAGLAASGTVTVECAIAGLPLTVVYILNPITFLIAKMLVKIPFFTMANIIAGKLLYEEYLQGDVNAANLAKSMERILPGGERREEILAGVCEVRESLTVEGCDGSAKAAEVILRTIGGGDCESVSRLEVLPEVARLHQSGRMKR